MKRRSARPFTVEIKQTRTSRASLSEATAHSREGQALWHDVSLAEPEAPPVRSSVPAIQVAPRPPEAPSRRILPSLVPMYAPPSESEPREEAPVVERLPRVRRPKELLASRPFPARTEARQMREREAAEAESPVQVFAPRPAEDPVARTSAGPAVQPTSAQPRSARLARKAAALAPGERWKRRLPRVLW